MPQVPGKELQCSFVLVKAVTSEDVYITKLHNFTGLHLSREDFLLSSATGQIFIDWQLEQLRAKDKVWSPPHKLRGGHFCASKRAPVNSIWREATLFVLSTCSFSREKKLSPWPRSCRSRRMKRFWVVIHRWENIFSIFSMSKRPKMPEIKVSFWKMKQYQYDGSYSA